VILLRCSWETEFAGETATFIVECAEDDNDEVVRAAKVLKEAVEQASGERLDTL